MRHLLPLTLLAIACATDPSDASGLQSPSGPPPLIPPLLQPDLHVGNVVVGEPLYLVVDDVNPGATVHMAWGTDLGRGPCLPALGGACTGILRPQLLGTATADSSGVASLTVTVPTTITIDRVAFQAWAEVGPGSYLGSQALGRIIQDSPPVPVEINPVLVGTFMPHEPNDMFVNGNTAFIEVSYGGGCADHDFVLAWDGSYMESFPIQVGLTLWHDPHGDPCDAWITERLRFDLGPIRAAWPYGEPEELWLHVGGVSDMYTF